VIDTSRQARVVLEQNLVEGSQRRRRRRRRRRRATDKTRLTLTTCALPWIAAKWRGVLPRWERGRSVRSCLLVSSSTSTSSGLHSRRLQARWTGVKPSEFLAFTNAWNAVLVGNSFCSSAMTDMAEKVTLSAVPLKDTAPWVGGVKSYMLRSVE
jgi:hypothetical protein